MCENAQLVVAQIFQHRADCNSGVITSITCVICSGEGTVYHLDEMTGALVISHTLVISSKDYPGVSSDQ